MVESRRKEVSSFSYVTSMIDSFCFLDVPNLKHSIIMNILATYRPKITHPTGCATKK